MPEQGDMVMFKETKIQQLERARTNCLREIASLTAWLERRGLHDAVVYSSVIDNVRADLAREQVRLLTLEEKLLRAY